MANGPTASSASETAAANEAVALSVAAAARRKPGTSSVAESSVRCGRIAVWIAWNSISGARAINTTLKAKPAMAVASAPAADFTIRGPAFRKACSHTMIRSTAVANPAPCASVNSVSAGGSSSAATSAASATRTSRTDVARTRRPNAHGTTSSDSTGATAIPVATNDCDVATPTTASRANVQRETDSTKTSAPYSANRRVPARKPRAKYEAAYAGTATTSTQ